MTKAVKIPDPVYEQAQQVSDERDVSLKEAIAIMVREAGYDV